MAEKCFCHFNGYQVKDATARKDIETLKEEDNSIKESFETFKEEDNSYKEAHALEEVGKKTEDGGEIFGDYENNSAIGKGSSASGIKTKAGNKAFKILAISKKEEAHTYDITLRGDVSSGAEPYVIGDIVQITANVNFNNCFKISNISITDGNSVVTVERVDMRSVQAMSLGYEHPSNAENWLYVAGKDNGEISPWLAVATATGEEVVASGNGAFGSGYDNVISGDFGFSSGRANLTGYAGFTSGAQNEAGDYAFASGNGNKATGIDSFASGVNTQATKYGSRAGGSGTVARNEFATAEGLGTRTYRQAQFVCGQYNKARKNTLFEVGNGASETEFSNAFEVYEDGSIGAGGVITTPAEMESNKAFAQNFNINKDNVLFVSAQAGYSIEYGKDLSYTIPELAKYTLVCVQVHLTRVLCYVLHTTQNNEDGSSYEIVRISGMAPHFDSEKALPEYHMVTLVGKINDDGSVTLTRNTSMLVGLSATSNTIFESAGNILNITGIL